MIVPGDGLITDFRKIFLVGQLKYFVRESAQIRVPAFRDKTPEMLDLCLSDPGEGPTDPGEGLIDPGEGPIYLGEGPIDPGEGPIVRPRAAMV